MPPQRKTKKGQSTASAELLASVTEGTRRTQNVDQRHIGYTMRGVELTHLRPWARDAIRSGAGSETGQVFS